jgi:GTP-binding protein
VAFLGRSNVGKSSCINTLVQVRGTARTSRTPGRTQAINLFDVAGALLLADLPGYGFAKVPPKVQAAWKPLVEAYLFGRPSLVLSILLVDVRRPPGGMDADLLWSLRENRVPVVLVVTRCDKLSRQELQKALGILEREYRLPEGDLIPFSSLTGLGRDALVARIERNLR